MTRGCSATPSWRRPRSTPASPSTRSATSRARSSGWASTLRADPRPPDRRRMARPRLEVADVFRAHGAAWRKANAGHLSLAQLKVMSAIETCRTSGLGGHVEREAELLPVPYYHVVFTLPAAIGAIAFQNKAVVYDLLFKTAAETLTTIAADPKHLGARVGLTAVRSEER